jgi:hypothetical protein
LPGIDVSLLRKAWVALSGKFGELSANRPAAVLRIGLTTMSADFDRQDGSPARRHLAGDPLGY